jgi:Domain of unknown function (DUF397)
MIWQMIWHKSTYSGDGNCVETAKLPNGGMAVRDTKNRDGGMLTFDRLAWSEFIAAVKESRIS